MVEELLAAALLLALFVTLAREIVSPAAAMVATVVAFVLVGILPAEEAFLGLANPATISIAGLYVVARAIRDHGQLEHLVTRFLGEGSGGARPALARFVPTTVLLSGFVNNTPLVAATAPVIRGWGERHGVAATKLLIPLSYAAIIGGVLTVIGTAPNLVVSGMLVATGHSGLSFFEITPAGLPVAVLGGTALIVLAPQLLPDRRTPLEQVATHDRDYTLRLRVEENGSLDGLTVAGAELRQLQHAFLAGVIRPGEPMDPATPATTLHGGDELVFVGRVGSVRELLDRPGLVEAERAQTIDLDAASPGLIECIIGQSSDLVGTTLKRTAFRGRYGGAVIALHRASERIEGKLGTVELRAGDALLVLAEPTFAERWQGHRDFAVVIPHTTPEAAARPWARWITLGTFIGMVTLAATGTLPVLNAILVACSVLVGTRTIRFGRAVAALDLDVLLIVAAAIGLGTAVERSGLAKLLAGTIETVATATSAVVALAVVAVGTMVLTELITNVAAAALMVPIALDVAERVGADPTGFAVAVALAASASFLTPIGYQTNTIVYGLGGYRFGDYWKPGLPMTAITLATIVAVVPLVW